MSWSKRVEPPDTEEIECPKCHMLNVVEVTDDPLENCLHCGEFFGLPGFEFDTKEEKELADVV